MKCPKCEFINNDENVFCTNCGTKLDNEPLGKKCPKCEFINNDENVFCTNCGTKLDNEPLEKKCQICGFINVPEAKFCSICGSQIDESVINDIKTGEIKISTIQVKTQDKFGVTSVVVSSVALATGLLLGIFPLAIFGGIVGVITGIISTVKRGSSAKSILGIIFGCIAFIIGIVVLIAFLYLLDHPEVLREYQDWFL